uniref:Uncharacterized protein n=1 Tax=Arundo donax TaxID=35708 RepID=A0A0A9HHP4_ARUDO
MQPYSADVNIVDFYCSFPWFHNPEKSLDKS